MTDQTPPSAARVAVETFLTALDRAVLTWRIYPRSSQFVDRSIREVAKHRDRIGGPVDLRVRPTRILWETADNGGDYDGVAGLARNLHYQQIAAVRLTTALDPRTASALIGAIADGSPTAAPLLTTDLPGIEVEPLRVEGLFAEGGQSLGEDDDPWDNLLGVFAMQTGQAVGWNEIGSNSALTERFMGWTLDTENSSGELRRHAPADRFGLVCERMIERCPPEAVAGIVGACANLVQEFDPEVWLDLLSEPLPVGTDEVDLADEITRSLTQPQVLRLTRYALRTRSTATPRLYRFLHRVVSTREDGAQLAHSLDSARPAGAGNTWPAFSQLLDSEDPEPWVTSDYRGVLETSALEQTAPEETWDTTQLRRRWTEFDPTFVRARKARILVSLLDRERQDEDYQELARSLEDTLPALIEGGATDLLEDIVALGRDHSGDPRRSELQRERSSRILRALAEPEALQAMLRQIQRQDEASARALWRVLEILGEESVSHLMEALRTSPGSALRQLIARLLRRATEVPIEHLRNAVADARPAVARDGAWLSGQIVHPDAVRLLRIALRHDAPEVRTEAVRSLTAVPGGDAEEAIVESMSDAVLEVRVAAARAMRTRFEEHPAAHIVGYLQRRNFTGRNTAIVAAAAGALARIGSSAEIRALERVARKPLLFRRRRAAACEAASEAIAAIREREQSRPLEVVSSPQDLEAAA